LVLSAPDHGLVQRADIIAIYEESGSDQGAADKAINRWLKAGRLVKKAAGVSMSLATDEPQFLKVSMMVLREVREVWGEIPGGSDIAAGGRRYWPVTPVLPINQWG
jgi:hypothetical protein